MFLAPRPQDVLFEEYHFESIRNDAALEMDFSSLHRTLSSAAAMLHNPAGGGAASSASNYSHNSNSAMVKMRLTKHSRQAYLAFSTRMSSVEALVNHNIPVRVLTPGELDALQEPQSQEFKVPDAVQWSWTFFLSCSFFLFFVPFRNHRVVLTPPSCHHPWGLGDCPLDNPCG